MYESIEYYMTKAKFSPSKYHFRFLEWLILKSFLCNYTGTTIKVETIAYNLRMHEKYWQTGRKDRVIKIVEEAAQIAYMMDYLLHFDLSSFYLIFTPNKVKLYPKGD